MAKKKKVVKKVVGKANVVEKKGTGKAKCKANIGKIVLGLILLVIALWVVISMTDPLTQYVGGILLAIIGLALLVTASKKCN